MDAVETPDSTPAALRRLSVISITLVACGLLSYALPGTQRVRPWVRGEGIPVARLYDVEQAAELPQFQGAAAAAVPAASAAAAPSPGGAARGPAQPQPPLAGAAAAIDPSEYADVALPIENVQALEAFYKSLARTLRAEPSAITRIAHYGDSAIAADEITLTLRRKMQARFGDAGHGFMLMARGTMHYLHRDIVHRESDGWQLSSVVRNQLRSGLYGYGGIVAHARGGEYAAFGTVDDGVGQRVSRFEIFYQRFPSGGDLRLSVDGGPAKAVSTRAATTEDAWETVAVPDGPHLLSLRTSGNESRVYGIVLERDVPGVVYDSLGLVGAQADRLLNADPKHMAGQIAHRAPNLLVLGFGGNEAGNQWLDTARYAASLERVIKLMRAGNGNMSCLLFGPLDQGERDERGNLVTFAVLPGIVEAQRRVAVEQGCAYYDTFNAMGGKNTIARWYKQRPRLIGPDFRHATPAGYDLVGTQYYKALLKGFADYLAQH